MDTSQFLKGFAAVFNPYERVMAQPRKWDVSLFF
jgi:hypothetical protein